MLNLFSNEVIDFRTSSAFAQELTNIFQECIDKRESYATIKERITHVPKFFNTTSVPKIIKAIKTHTGITCNKIYTSKYLDLGYACLMQFGDKYGLTAADIINRYSGLGSDAILSSYMKSMKISPKTAEDMEEVANSLNRSTGLFSNTTINNKINCEMVMYFDPYGSFLMKECGQKNVDYLLAPEITGIVLHEIGHMVSTLAHSADRCLRMLAYNRELEYFLKNSTAIEKAKYLGKVAEKNGDKKLALEIKTAIDTCTTVDASTQKGSWILDAFCVFINAISGLFSCISIPIGVLVDLLGGFFMEFIGTSNFNKHGKLSDLGPTNQGAKLCEQFADEYVAKHGMASWQASALNKIFSYSMASTGVYATNSGKFTYSSAKISTLVLTIAYGDLTGGGGLYDMQADRIKHLQEALAKVFKNPDIPDDMRKMYIEDYKRISKNVANKSTFVKIQNSAETFHKMLRYLGGTLPSLLFTGRFDREYEALLNKAQTLTANSLFYRATELDNLKRNQND